MGRNRSHRSGRSTGRKPHSTRASKSGSTLASQGKIPTTNLIAVTKTDTTHCKLQFDRPVYAGAATTSATESVVLSGTGITTRGGISAVQNSATFVSIQASGAIATGKTCHVTIGDPKGLVVPVSGKFGTKTGSYAT